MPNNKPELSHKMFRVMIRICHCKFKYRLTIFYIKSHGDITADKVVEVDGFLKKLTKRAAAAD